MTVATYEVSGMTCAHCVQAVSSELKALDGVHDVRVELAPGGLSDVTVTSDNGLGEQVVAAALGEAGDYQLAAAVLPGRPAADT